MNIDEYRKYLKIYLNRYVLAKRRLNELKETHDVILSDSNSPQYGAGYKEFPRVMSSSVNMGAASFSIKLADIEDRIAVQQDKLKSLVLGVLEILDYLPPDSLERSALELCYIKDKKVEACCYSMCVSRSTFFEIKKNAIDTLLKYEKVKQIVLEFAAKEKENVS
ncbi:MAG: DUF1492 domain-containing protein [Ruminococcus sp.]